MWFSVWNVELKSGATHRLKIAFRLELRVFILEVQL